MKFATNNKTSINFNMGYDNKTIEVRTTKLHGLQNDSNWKKHAEYIIPTLSLACSAMRTVAQLLKIDILKLIFFAFFHYIMSYGVMLWGTSTESTRVFIIQNKMLE